MATDVGTGTTITFGTSSFSAPITNVAGDGITRPSIDTSHMGSTSRTFIPGDLVDHGTLTVDIDLDPDDQPPISGAAETVTVTFPSGATLAGSAFCTDWSFGVPLVEKITASFTLKWAGVPTWTDAA